MKIILAIVLLGAFAATAIPVEHYKHHDPHHKKEAKPYSFSYGVHDEYNGNIFNQEEKSDGNQVEGSYTVHLPDGRKQTVKYHADHHKGFTADVTYYGKAQYPPKSPHPPFIVKPNKYEHEPSHHEAPIYHKPEPIYH